MTKSIKHFIHQSSLSVTAMSRSLFPSCRLPAQILSSVTSRLQCIRTAATLKYFHPIHEITSQKDLYGKDPKDLPPMPPYPYGPNRYFPAADTGLYGGAKVQSGN